MDNVGDITADSILTVSVEIPSVLFIYLISIHLFVTFPQWRSEGNWRPGAKLNFAPPPSKLKKKDI